MTMQTLIESYENHPGEHCGSVAMRGLLHHYCGLELPEHAVFGLGSGAACIFVSSPAMDPTSIVFGRRGSLEVDIASALDVDYREEIEPDDDVAWQRAREEVLAGRPTMLSGDILYLDYREYKVHFPGHRFVLLGFDDATEKAYIADRINVEPELCSYAALKESRNPRDGLSTNNLWGRFESSRVGRSLEEAARIAIDRCAERMLEESAEDVGFLLGDGEGRVVTGVAGIRALAEDIPRWPSAKDPGWIASYNARCIEKFGNGGGNFRRLYAGFLAWAHALDASLVPADAATLATHAADGWTDLSATLAAAAKEDAAPGLFERAAEQAVEVADREQELFEKLSSRRST
jgi:hypothetical protein